MAFIKITDFNPDAESNGVATNALIWIKFDRRINWPATISSYWLSVIEHDTLTPVVGTLSRTTDVSGIQFAPETLLKPLTRYRVYVFSGTSGVSSGTGSATVYLQEDFSWAFTTGANTGTGTDTQPSADLETPVADAITTYLEVSTTDPADLATNQSRTKVIRVTFKNGKPTLPSGKTWSDYITVTKVGVLG